MAGAFARYADGGEVDDGQDQPGQGGILGALGQLLGGADQAPLTDEEMKPSPQVSRMYDVANSVMDPSKMGGALSAAQSRANSAYADRIAAINKAKAVLGAGRGNETNLPLFLASAGLLAPTSNGGGFAESLSNAARAAAPAIQAQRDATRQDALDMSNLDIKAADTELDQANAGTTSLEKQFGLWQTAYKNAVAAGNMELAQKAKQKMAQLAYQGKIDVANINASARLSAAQLRAAGAAPAHIREAEILVKNGIAPDLSAAYAMVRAPGQDGVAFQRLVQAEKVNLSNSLATMSLPDDEKEAMARATVIARAKFAPKPGQIAVPGQAPLAAPAGAPAAAAVAAPTVAAPTAPSNPPAKAVPPGAGTAKDPYKATTQAQIDWFKAHAPAGSVINVNGTPYTK